MDDSIGQRTDSLKTERIALRPVEPSDYGLMYRKELAGNMLHRWRFGGSTPSPEAYPAAIWAGVYSQYLICDNRSELLHRPIGLVLIYDLELVHGVAHFAATKFEDGILASALFVEGLALYIDVTFQTTPLRKLYMEVPEYNISSFGTAVGTVFKEEARLRDRRYYNGRYWDLAILAIERSDWSAMRIGLSEDASE